MAIGSNVCSDFLTECTHEWTVMSRGDRQTLLPIFASFTHSCFTVHTSDVLMSKPLMSKK